MTVTLTNLSYIGAANGSGGYDWYVTGNIQATQFQELVGRSLDGTQYGAPRLETIANIRAALGANSANLPQGTLADSYYRISGEVLLRSGSTDAPVTAYIWVPSTGTTFVSGKFTTTAATVYGYSRVQVIGSQGTATTEYMYGYSTPPTALSAPTGFTATAASSSSVVLAWTPTSGSVVQELTRTIGTTTVTSYFNGTQSTWTDTGLSPATAYSYKIRCRESYPTIWSAYATASATTQSAPPGVPTGLAVQITGPSSAYMTCTVTSGDSSYKFGWSKTQGGPYSVKEIAAPESGTVVRCTVSGLDPETLYYFVVAGKKPTSAYSDYSTEITGTTGAVIPYDQEGDGGDTNIPSDANVSAVLVSGKLMIFSDRNRPLVYQNRTYYPMGLKGQLNAPTVSAESGGALTGEYTAYVVMYSSGRVTRSVHSPGSAVQILSSQRLKVIPDLTTDGTKVLVRDTAVDSFGHTVDACDKWEIYVHESTMDKAVRVAELPLSTLSYTLPSALTLQDLKDGTRRPMELQFESALPPACAYAAYRDQESRLYVFGERTIKPTAEQITNGAKITMTNGSKQAVVSGFSDLNDAVIYKELYLNKAGTGWFVSDVEGTTVFLTNANTDQNLSGFQGVTGSYLDFAFAAKPSRVYRSAYFSGEAGGGATFSPETFPPFNVIEGQLDVNDNKDPIGAIASKDTLFLFKPQRTFYVEDGQGLDGTAEGFPSIITVSRSSGCVANKSLAIDRYDRVFGMTDKGPALYTRSGVQLIGQISGTEFMFQTLFDQETISRSVAEFFPRDDYYVVAGLDLIGNSGGRDGFICDTKNDAFHILPFTYPRRITELISGQTDNGGYQLLAGDEFGWLNSLFTSGIYKDDYDYTSGSRTDNVASIACSVTTGILYPPEGKSMAVIGFQPRMRQQPLTTAITGTFAVDTRPNMSSPASFTSSTSRTFVTSNSIGEFRMQPRQTQSARCKISWNSELSERVELQSVIVSILSKGKSAQDQNS